MDLGTEERRVVIEVIATLVYHKNRMAELILEPAGIPRDIYSPLLHRRDPVSGRELSKREIAPFILDAMAKRSDGIKAILSIIKIAANWPEERFYLADKEEYKARAAVLKARYLLGNIQRIEEQETKQQEQRSRELELIEREQERERLFEIFKDLWESKDARYRGFQLEKLLKRTFDLYNIPMYEPFRRNQGSEQIDGAFKLDGWYYLVECKWQARLADSSQTDAFSKKISRSSKQTMGLFLSINGWSEGVLTTLKQDRDKCIFLMDGRDLYYLLSSSQLNLREFLIAKNDALTLKCEPFLGIDQYLQQR